MVTYNGLCQHRKLSLKPLNAQLKLKQFNNYLNDSLIQKFNYVPFF